MKLEPYLLSCTLENGHTDSINCLSFSPNGRFLASGGDDRLLIIWNVERGRIESRMEFDSPVLSVLWDPRRPFSLVCGCENGTTMVYMDFHVSLLSPCSCLLIVAQPHILARWCETSSAAWCQCPRLLLGPWIPTWSASGGNRPGGSYSSSNQIRSVFSLYLMTLRAELLIPGHYATSIILPKPFDIPGSPDTRVRPRSTYFIEDGNHLLVAYLSHGIM